MYLPIRIHYYTGPWRETYVEDPAAYAALRTELPNLPVECPQFGPEFWAEPDDLAVLDRLDISWELDKEALASKTGSMVVKLQDRLRAAGARTTEEALTRSAAVQITIPDFGLLSVDQVEVLEDACTDLLQDKLDAGWRILAVCPPNAQRRPDYILGRRRG